MAVIFKHPELADYIGTVGAVRLESPQAELPSLTRQFETGQLTFLRKLRLQIDHDFWGGLPVDRFPALAELRSTPAQSGGGRDELLDASLAAARLPRRLARRLKSEMQAIYAQILPVHAALFAGYRPRRPQISWRLAEVRGEPLHLEVPADPETQRATLLVNLDNQPCIWMSGPRLEDLAERYGPSLPPPLLRAAPAPAVLAALGKAAFGDAPVAWSEDQPKHVIYFDPGDVWIQDLRLAAHQTFYGRRLLRLDFDVDPASMRKRSRHYLVMADALRARMLKFLPGPSPAS